MTTTVPKSPEKYALSKKSSLEELLFYKGQPALFYHAHLKKPDYDLQGIHFPSKLVKSFSMAQILCGFLLVVFGLVAIFVNASLAYLGGGVWSGSLIFVTGVIGICAARNPKNSVQIVAFLIFSLFGVASCGLIIVLAATGVAGDVNSPDSYYVDSEGIPVTFLGRFSTSVPAVAANSSILVVAIISCLLALGSCVLSAKEACQCYDSFSCDSSVTGPSATTRRDRLLSWLGQQAILNTLPPMTRSTLVNQSPRGRWPDQRGDGTFTLKTSSMNSTGDSLIIPSRIAVYKQADHKKCLGEKDGQPSNTSAKELMVREEELLAAKETAAKSDKPKLDDKYTAVDRKMAEDYIERLLVIDEKRLSEMYEVILKDGIERERE